MRDCDHCGVAFAPAAAHQRFCARRCRNAAKAIRVKNDPEQYAKHRVAQKRWDERNRHRIKLWKAAWAKANAVEQSRLKRVRDAVGAGADSATAAYVTALYRDPCAYCGEPADTIDHITPTSLGGPLVTDNVTAACRRCNSTKNDRPLLVFLAHLNGCYEITFRRDRKPVAA